MKIFNNNSNKYIFQKPLKTMSYATSPLSPLPQDTVSFGALKKTQFEGIDLAVVEKFKAPIEKFNSNDDLQNWAGEKANKIANHDFGGRQEKTRTQRKAMIKEWADYVLKENDAYNNAAALLILNAVTKDLNADNDKLPPVLNKGVLADCISEIDKNAKSDRKYQFNLNKMYETKLRAVYLEGTKNENQNTGWVVIPSKDNDPENFKKNVGKLKTLSYKNWCTESYNAERYLTQGDFHVYLENRQPRVGLRFIGDKIEEIQGKKNNNEIPICYFDKIQKHIEDENFQLRENAKVEIENALAIKKEIDKIKKDLESAIANKDTKAIFECFNIKAEEDKDGFLTISRYKQPTIFFTFSDIGIDEKVLLQKVKVISGDADFYDSQITNLGNIESIGGNANFSNSQIKDLSNLKSIGNCAFFNNSQITDLGNLESIGSDAFFSYSKVTNPGKLKTIGGEIVILDSKLSLSDFDNIKVG